MLRLCPVRCQTHSITIMWENQSHFSYLSKNNTRIWSAGGWKQKPFLELRSGIFDMNQTHSWWVEAYALCKYNYHQCIKQLTCTFNCSHRHNTATRCLTARTTGWLNDFFSYFTSWQAFSSPGPYIYGDLRGALKLINYTNGKLANII